MLQQGAEAPTGSEGWLRREAGTRPSVADFKSLRLAGLLASRWIAFNVVVLAVGLVFAVWHVSIIGGGRPDFTAYEASVDRLELAAVANLVVYLVGAAVFLFWFHRAYANLERLEAGGMRHSKKWAVISWFVPIVNLWHPKQIANDAWRGSEPDVGEGTTWANHGPLPAFLDLWWAFWVLSTFGWSLYFRMPVDTLAQEKSAHVVVAVVSVIDIVCGALAIVFIRRLTRRQEARAAALRAA